MTKYDYDVICIGSGSASGAAAFVAKKAGFRVAIVEAEKDRLGGHCPNYACVPTKALLNAAKVLKTARHAQDFGIEARQVSFDFKKVALYRDNIVTQLTGMRIERNLHNAGIDLIWGFAKFVSEHELEVAAPSEGGARKYSAEHIVIGVGSKEFIPPIEGLAETGFWISDQAVRLTELPRSIIIIGAGPVGTEFTQIFSSFGVETTLLQREDQILQREDKEIAQIVQKDLESRGVNIVLNMEIVRVQKHGQEKIVTIKTDGQEQDFRAQEILVAAGRRAALADLNLEAAGLVLNQLGKLDLNEYLQTDKAHIWVAGDAAANWQFTHTAAYEGDLVGRNICHKHDEATNYDVIPRVTFCEPEVASVGMTEGEAQKKGLEVEIARYPMGNLGRALIDLDRRGLVKIIIEKKSRAILGAHIAGNNAGQLIHEIAVAMKGKLSIETVAKTIHAYPSYSEAIGATAEKFLTF